MNRRILPFPAPAKKSAFIPPALDDESPAALRRKGLAALQWLRENNFIGRQQADFTRELIGGEEGGFYVDRMLFLRALIADMPATYGQEESPDPVAFLHYFIGGYDGYIFEKDAGDPDDTPEDRQCQAYGFARWSHMPDSAECGYISLPEILASGAELDYHFQPIPLSAIKARFAPKDAGEPASAAKQPSEIQTPQPPQEDAPQEDAPQADAAPADMRRIKERLAKLLRLGEDSAASEGEIGNALRIASELMARHQLTRDDIDTEALDPTARITIGRHFAFSKSRNMTLWEKSLSHFVSRFIGTVQHYISTSVPLRRNGVAMLDEYGEVRTGTIISFYGAESDTQVAAEMFEELRDDIARMAVIRWGGWAKADGATYAYGFCQGLEDARKQAAANLMNTDSQTTALMVKTQGYALAILSKADSWLTTQGTKVRITRLRGSLSGSAAALGEGRRDGANYNPHRPTSRPKLA